MVDRYAVVGPAYDFISTLFSGGAIRRCNVAHLDKLQPGDKVLFAGMGHGRDALYAAKRGAKVTVVDVSKTMLAQFKKTLKADASKVQIRQVHSDILQFNEPEKYDMVVANFFLNVFSREKMLAILEHMIQQGKPGAKIVIGDFEYPSGNALSQLIRYAYWYVAISSFWAVAGNAFHHIYDYPEIMNRLGLKVKEKKHIKLLSMDFYWSILGEKAG